MDSFFVDEKRKRKRLRRAIAVPIGIVLAVALFSQVSPLPVSLLLKIAFSNGNAVEPDDYEAIRERVTTVKNLTYPSKFESNTADIYIPKNGEGPFPVVLWVHGGAYVGGDKKDVEGYATALASQGIAVVCMNYVLAPSAKYPTPVIQTGEAYTWLCGVAAQNSLDMTRLVLAGDSAGAQIAAQFAAVQSNADYANEMGMERIVPPETIKAALLYCGPFDSEKINAVENKVMAYFLERAAWAYFGEKNWQHFAKQASVAGYVTKLFPPAFITDGNKASFEDHARDFADVLEKTGVPVETYFIDPAVEATHHEYQFVMNTPAGREAFRRTLDFLEEYVK